MALFRIKFKDAGELKVDPCAANLKFHHQNHWHQQDNKLDD
jgi:hypothetical protein